MPGCYRHTSHKKQTVKLGHNTSQLRQIRSHQFCAADQLSVGAAWAGMVWADVRNAPSKLKSESAPESGSYVR